MRDWGLSAVLPRSIKSTFSPVLNCSPFSLSSARGLDYICSCILDSLPHWLCSGLDYLIAWGPFQPVPMIGVAWKQIPNSSPEWEGGLSQPHQRSGDLHLHLGESPRTQDPQFYSRSNRTDYVIRCEPWDILNLSRSFEISCLGQEPLLASYRIPVHFESPKSKSNFLLSSYYGSGTFRSQRMSPVETTMVQRDWTFSPLISTSLFIQGWAGCLSDKAGTLAGATQLFWNKAKVRLLRHSRFLLIAFQDPAMLIPRMHSSLWNSTEWHHALLAAPRIQDGLCCAEGWPDSSDGKRGERQASGVLPRDGPRLGLRRPHRTPLS